MGEAPITVLLIEDIAEHALLIKNFIQRVPGSHILLETAQRLTAGLERLSRGGIHALLLDLWLPDSTGLDTIKKALMIAGETPIIVLTSQEDKEVALDAVKSGAQDFLVKMHLTAEILVKTIRHSIERKRLQTRLERSAAELERANNEIKNFASLIAQNLREPLNSVYSVCQSLEQRVPGPIEEALQEKINQGHEGMKRMRMLIDDLQAYVQLDFKDAGKRVTDCNLAFATVLKNLATEIAKSKATITCDSLPIISLGEAQLLIVFQNLIETVIQCRGGISPRVHVGASWSDGYWEFSVGDHTAGVDPKRFEQTFEPFGRLDAGRESPGIGIGLAICKKIIESSGGRICIASEMGKGSVFQFTLPGDPLPGKH